jgi:flagellum-specific ATP synthase
MNEPIADSTRGILDGHIVLSRKLAGKGHYPAIEVLESISRVMPDIVSKEQLQAAAKIRELIGIYRDNVDLITIGAYKPGQNRKLDLAVSLQEEIEGFLKQSPLERVDFQSSQARLLEIAAKAMAEGLG